MRLLIKYALAVERILITLWVGSLWVAGFLVAPTLFAVLDDRSLAGTIAGNLFTKVSYIGLICAAVLLFLNQLSGRGRGWRIWVIVTMLALVVIGQFGLTPMIAALRDEGLTETARFGQLHGVAGVLYLITSVLGLMLVSAGQSQR